MSTSDFQGAAHAFKRLMQLAQQDIDTGGEIKPVVCQRPHVFTVAKPRSRRLLMLRRAQPGDERSSKRGFR